MDYEIRWSEEAQNEIHDLLQYVLEEWGDKAAEQLSLQIIEVSELLEKHPYAGRRHELLRAVREFRIKPYYLLYYTVLEAKRELLILDIVDSRKKKQ